MNRVILSRPALPGTALAELKQWLGITTATDDAPLLSLLTAALDVCEAFTGQMPLETECEEVLSADAGWHTLATRPVQAIGLVESLDASGNRTALDPSAYEIDLASDGTGRVRLPLLDSTTRIVVSFTAGLAADWDALPESLRHGLIRLAAHQHREREAGGAAPLPPASVAALWRPWRRMHLT
ncbi:head-tail connector protein [Novosphingobium album (ex Hu et al. 2023)]|uniref:Phage gp6-like head-tail connector protein n=1 Tax=Novosphingobium album (ex Hu et al. 2023) TaxID=2930093 RepID=A0ABT0B0S0_9SPHN|nr:hypothetical protein [Novosphingobium album (ex Hu et al. 2023)]MCJ2178676.1 hypothetical protein [Novosphingobium album (ex Hu et al. 2023)]